jgi:hypothetical protein
MKRGNLARARKFIRFGSCIAGRVVVGEQQPPLENNIPGHRATDLISRIKNAV